MSLQIQPGSMIVLVTASSLSEGLEHKGAELNINTFCAPCGFLRDEMSLKKNSCKARDEENRDAEKENEA